MSYLIKLIYYFLTMLFSLVLVGYISKQLYNTHTSAPFWMILIISFLASPIFCLVENIGINNKKTQ